MPFVEKLYKSLKNQPDVLVLTLNVDEQPERARAFVKKSAFAVPVLLAHSFLRGMLEQQIDLAGSKIQVAGMPRSWVLDRNLVFRTDEVGFNNKKNDWVEKMTRRIQQASVTSR